MNEQDLTPHQAQPISHINTEQPQSELAEPSEKVQQLHSNPKPSAAVPSARGFPAGASQLCSK